MACKVQQRYTSARYSVQKQVRSRCTAVHRSVFRQRIRGPWRVCRQTIVEAHPASSCLRPSCAYDRRRTSGLVWSAVLSALHRQWDLHVANTTITDTKKAVCHAHLKLCVHYSNVTDRQKEFSSLDRVCIPCSAVMIQHVLRPGNSRPIFSDWGTELQ